MGYLDANRVLDPDDGEQFVIAHKDLEVALSEIFGIPLERRITQSILGTVAADGSFTMIRLKSKSGASTANAAGIELRNGHVAKRILYIGSKILVYNRVGTSWELAHDFETEANPNLTDLEDVDKTQVELSDANKNKIVYTVLGGNNRGVLFGLAKNEVASDGAKSFFELDEVGAAWNTRWPGATCRISEDGESLSPHYQSTADPYWDPFRWAGYVRSKQITSAQNDDTPWNICGPWTRLAGSQYPTYVSIGGQQTAGVNVPRGVYSINLSANIVSSANLKGSIKWGPLCPAGLRFPNSTQWMTKGMPHFVRPAFIGGAYGDQFVYPISNPSFVNSVKVDLGTQIVAIGTDGKYIGAQIWQNTPSHIIADLTFTIVGIK